MSNAIYFTKLIVENIRSFAKKQVLDLVDDAGRPAPWTLIVGDNGVGKPHFSNVLYECARCSTMIQTTRKVHSPTR